MTLFDQDIKRDSRPFRLSISRYDCLEHDSCPASGRVRDVLEMWFSEFPEKNKAHLFKEFTSCDDRKHLAGFWELYVHALLRRHGFDVETEPPHSHVDFKVSFQRKHLFNVECMVVGESNAEHKIQGELNAILDSINKIPLDIFLSVHVVRKPQQPSGRPPKSTLCACLRHQYADLAMDDLVGLSYDEVIERFRWTWDNGSWGFAFYPIAPNRRGVRKSKSGTVGMFSGMSWLVSGDVLRKKSLKKLPSKYGASGVPYVIAVNYVRNPLLSDWSVMNALFGREFFEFRVPTESVEYSRRPTGLWQGPDGPRNTRISGVLFVPMMTAAAAASKTPILWHNSWAKKPLPRDLWEGPQMVPNLDTGQIERKKGKAGWEILGLNPNWPDKD